MLNNVYVDYTFNTTYTLYSGPEHLTVYCNGYQYGLYCMLQENPVEGGIPKDPRQ